MDRHFTLEQIERALDTHIMQGRMRNGRLWAIQRNGKTQTWKARPGEWRIPIKAGLRSYGELTHKSIIGLPGDGELPDFFMNTMCP